MGVTLEKAKEEIKVEDAELVLEETLASGDADAVANTLDALISVFTSEEIEDTEANDPPEGTIVTNKIEPDTSAGGAQPEPTKKPKKPKKMEDDKSRAIMTLLAETVEKAPTPAVLSSVVGGISTLVLINEDEEEPAPEDDEVTADQDNQGNQDSTDDRGTEG